jgi:hypothetical protein
VGELGHAIRDWLADHLDVQLGDSEIADLAEYLQSFKATPKGGAA